MQRRSRLVLFGVAAGMVASLAGTAAMASADPPSTDQIVTKAVARAPRHNTHAEKDLKAAVDRQSKRAALRITPADDISVTPADADNSISKAQPDGFQVLTVLRQGNQARFRLDIPRGLTLAPNGAGYDLTAAGPTGPVVLLTVDAPWAVDADGKQLPTTYALRGSTLIQTVDTTGADYPITADPYFARKWYGAQIQFTWNESRAMAVSAGGVAVVAGLIPDPTISKIVMFAAGAVAWWAGSATYYGNCIALNVYWTGQIAPWYWHCPH